MRVTETGIVTVHVGAACIKKVAKATAKARRREHILSFIICRIIRE
jgi:hypothetical protein